MKRNKSSSGYDFKKSRKFSLKEKAYQSIKEWILYTKIKPGTLLNERDLAKELGISRTPLREVLQRLSYQRLIMIHPRRGIFVTPIDYEILKSIFEVRVPLEKTAAALCARMAKEEDILSLQEIIAESYQAQKDGNYEYLIRLDQRFHEKIGEISRNEVLREILEDLHNICLRFWYINQNVVRNSFPKLETLEKVVTAIKNRDSESAASLLGEHVLSFLPLFDQETTQGLKVLSNYIHPSIH